MDEKLKLYEEKNPNQLSPQQFDLIRRDLESTKATKSDEYFDFILWCENMPSRGKLDFQTILRIYHFYKRMIIFWK